MSDSKRRRLIEMQGYEGLTDRHLREIDPWLRFAPAVCAMWAATATTLGSTWGLWQLSMVAALGATLPVHPIDLLYNGVIRRLMRTSAIPPTGLPRRFGYGMAMIFLTSAGAAFQEGATIAGTVIGYLFVAGAMVPVLTGFCMPAWIYSRNLARVAPRRAADSVTQGAAARQ